MLLLARSAWCTLLAILAAVAAARRAAASLASGRGGTGGPQCCSRWPHNLQPGKHGLAAGCESFQAATLAKTAASSSITECTVPCIHLSECGKVCDLRFSTSHSPAGVAVTHVLHIMRLQPPCPASPPALHLLLHDNNILAHTRCTFCYVLHSRMTH
jgi:hypothetical protein